jgi:GNAT superfamily N-acetyltransferase
VSEVQVRSFQRSDRDQLTALVSAHAAALVPGASVSVNTVLSQLEREPGEDITDPWVTGRRTLVAVRRQAVVAGAHLLRYGSEPQVGPDYRGAGEIGWLVCRPDAEPAGDALLAAGRAVLDDWGASPQYADGRLPVLAAYGVPDCWPHIRAIYRRGGFTPQVAAEVILVAQVERLPGAAVPPLPGLRVERSAGSCGTRFTARLDGADIGMIEVDTDHTAGGTRSRLAGWADVGNLCVAAAFRRRRVGTWLAGQAADWLRLGRASRLLSYADPEDPAELAFWSRLGFTELARTERGWRYEEDGKTG